MQMYSTVKHTKLELKQARLPYKINVHRILRRGIVKVKVGDYIWLDVQNRKPRENGWTHRRIFPRAGQHHTQLRHTMQGFGGAFQQSRQMGACPQQK